jgi:hypothetical protein
LLWVSPESLTYEVRAIWWSSKIEPGMIATDFGGRSFDFSNDENITEYKKLLRY